jgi:hypothetical protein
MKDSLNWNAHWLIERFYVGESEPYNVTEFEHNCALHVGINLLFQLLVGDDANHFDNANAQIGIGDDDTTATATQTGLQAAVNTDYKGMMTGYPEAGVLQRVDFRSTFEDGEAEFDWNEFIVRNKSGGTCLNRKVSAQGEKRAGQIWIIRLRITLS